LDGLRFQLSQRITLACGHGYPANEVPERGSLVTPQPFTEADCLSDI
jgi:hypothetical protein